MTLSGTYVPSTAKWVRDQVDKIEETGTTRSVHIMNRPVIMLTMRGARSGSVRKVPVMRVEHDGAYAAVASKGGAPQNPQWYHNLVTHPEVELQDDTETWTARARQVTGEERAVWWRRCVEAYPPYEEYQERTDREIPVFVLERV